MAKFISQADIDDHALKNPTKEALVAYPSCVLKVDVQYQYVQVGETYVVCASNGSKEIYSPEKFNELFNVA